MRDILLAPLTVMRPRWLAYLALGTPTRPRARRFITHRARVGGGDVVGGHVFVPRSRNPARVGVACSTVADPDADHEKVEDDRRPSLDGRLQGPEKILGGVAEEGDEGGDTEDVGRPHDASHRMMMDDYDDDESMNDSKRGTSQK